MPARFRVILVPYDFSPQAEEALRLAVSLVPTGGRLLLLHAIEPLPAGPDVPAWFPPDDLVAQRRTALQAVSRRVTSRRDVAVDARVVVGNPFRSIVAAARDADLIVIATTGRTGLAHMVIGSVAEKVVRHAPIPVLTIRGHRRRGLSRPSMTMRPRSRVHARSTLGQ